MSYWTKRRKVQVEYDKILKNIANDDPEMTGDASLTSENSNVGLLTIENDINSALHYENENMTFDLSAKMDNLGEDYTPLDGDLSSSSDDELPYDSKKGLDELLHAWAIKNNITQSALGELLVVLKRLDPDLPKDPRTLLSSRKVEGIESIEGGQYYHFGM